MSESTVRTAIWTPGWYELDQTLVLGERQKYWFFQNPPTRSKRDQHPSADDELVFYNQLDSTKNCCVRYAKIVEMIHPQLGALMRIDTDGLDYIFYPVAGEEVIVNAEEDPGSIYDSNGTAEISDWSVFVKLTDVSEPANELAFTSG